MMGWPFNPAHPVTHVRPLRPRKYLRCSQCGIWFSTGQPIHFSEDGAYCAACLADPTRTYTA